MDRRKEDYLERRLADLERYLSATPTLLFLLDKEGIIFFMSSPAARYLGDKAKMMVGRRLGEADLPPGLYQLFNKQNRAVLQTGRNERGEIPFPTVLGERWFEYDISPVFDEEGRIEGTVAMVADITDRKRTEEALKRSNEELQQFAYVASHDLREPLRMIESYLGLLYKKYEGKVLDKKAEEYIEFAVDGAARMREIINDLLAYSRIDTRGKPFSLVDMEEVLATALKDLRTSIEESGALITHTNLPSVMADKMQMVLLLENLIGNSIKFRDVEAPQIHVSAQRRWNDLVFSIQDNGIGIPREQQDRIFEMFQRLHTKEEYEGTGIGLAISKKIVERHGGRIWVESEEGKGSTFFFTIPNRTKASENGTRS